MKILQCFYSLQEPSQEDVIISDVTYSASAGTSNSSVIFNVIPLESPHETPYIESENSATAETSSKKVKLMNQLVTTFDLQTVLNSSAIGKALLNWHILKGGFDSTRQGYLVEIIASYFLNENCL